MKVCPTLDCPVHQSGREFNADDNVCPQCGATLVPVGGAVPPERTRDPWLERVLAIVAALVILLLVFGVAVGAAGVLRGQPTLDGGVALPPTATAGELASNTGVTSGVPGNGLPNTPLVPIATATSFVTPLPPSTGSGSSINSGTGPTPVSGVGSGASNATSAVIPGVSGVRLCRRIAGGEPCEPVAAYGIRDAFNLAVQAGFGPGGARSARVRWYGPDGALLYASEPVVPGRTGTYWIAFTLTQSQPWTRGVYRAEIYLDEVLMRQVDIVVVP